MIKSTNELESLKHLAKPFFFKGSSDLGILLVHGFTASPTEILPIGKFLHNQGYTVYGVRLAGHGTNYTELPKYTWKDWYQSVEEGIVKIKEQCNSLVPIGLSLGALLSLYLIYKHPEIDFQKLILLSPPFGLKSRLANLAPILKYVVKYSYKGDASLQYFKKHNLYSYMYRPLSALAQLIYFQKYIEKQNIKLKTPTMIAYGRNDDMISIPAINKAIKRMFTPTSQVQLLELPKSGHILTVEPDSKDLFRSIAKFLNNTE
ncbi:MAG: alpha/beta hydrolase [Candidatus Hodarchaeota archaeon]